MQFYQTHFDAELYLLSGNGNRFIQVAGKVSWGQGDSVQPTAQGYLVVQDIVRQEVVG